MQFEIDFILWLQDRRSHFLDLFFEFFTLFGEEIVLIIILGFIYWCLDKEKGETIGLIIFVSLAFNSLLKWIVMRPRPFMVESEIVNLRPETSGGFAFPSGHTQTAATTFFSLHQAFKRRWLLILASVITFFVAFSRMYIGVHYLTDVLAGAGFGVLFAYLGFRYVPKITDKTVIYRWLFIAVNLGFIAVLVVNSFAHIEELGFNAEAFYFSTEAIAKMFGTISGFILAIQYEQRHVHFTQHKILYKNIIRFALGLGIIMAVRLSLSALFDLIVNPANLDYGDSFKAIFAVLLDYIRYTLMLLVGIGIYPKLFKPLNI